LYVRSILMKLSLTPFAIGTKAGSDTRHFDSDFAGTKITNMTPDEFEAHINAAAMDIPLQDGYAPFCKHLIIPSITADQLSGIVAITDENRSLLQTGYSVRRADELPVLSRWFAAVDVEVPAVPYLDVVLYSTDALKGEGIKIDGDWGVVSINSAMEAHEDPMDPMTQVRNALGKEQGGSGHPIDRDAYMRGVEFWGSYANVK
jgi:hypothetical protein